MRIVDASARMGNQNAPRDYRVRRAPVLIGIICGFLSACAMPVRDPPTRSEVAAPAMLADDLALIERLQAEYALQGGDRLAAAERLGKAAVLSDDPKHSLSALRAALLANKLAAAQALLARWRSLEADAPALPAYAAALALAHGDSANAHVAADQLGGHRLERRGDVEAAVVLADLREEHALEDQVTDLITESVGILAVDRVHDLGSFFEDEARQCLERLLAVPRTSVRPAQSGHDFDQFRERSTGIGRGHGRQGPYASIRRCPSRSTRLSRSWATSRGS